MKKGSKELGIYTYMRRLLTAFLAVVLLVSNIPEVSAEGFESSNPKTAEPLENIVSDDENAEVSDNVLVDEEEIDEDVQVDATEDADDISENIEESEETVQLDDATSIVNGNSSYDLPDETNEYTESIDEVYTPVLLEDEGIITPDNPSLSLSQAKEYKFQKSASEEISPIEVVDERITVKGGPGLTLLSNVYAVDYQNKTIVLSSEYFAGWDTTTEQEFYYEDNNQSNTAILRFLGLGTDAIPFNGNLEIDSGSNQLPITTIWPLFNAVYTSVSIYTTNENVQVPVTLNFWPASKPTEKPLLADNIFQSRKSDDTFSDDTLSCVVNINNESGAGTIGGIVGNLKENAKVEITLANNMTNLTVKGSGNRGLFCNTINEASKLTAHLKASGNVTITSTSGNSGGFVGVVNKNAELIIDSLVSDSKLTVTSTATSSNVGGLVGLMEENSTLTSNKVPVSEVSATGSSSNIGGIVGTVNKATINSSSTLYAPAKVSGLGGGSYVGGLFGKYSQSNSNFSMDSYSLSKSDITSTITATITAAGSYGGGAIGHLENSGGTIEISGTKGATINSRGDNSYTFGGLIGIYTSTPNNLQNTLKIRNLTVSSEATGSTSYGGIIGKLMTTCYVEMENIDSSTNGSGTQVGGLVSWIGENSPVFLNANNVSMTSQNGFSGERKGGLIGYMQRGVLRLSGETVLKDTAVSAGSKTGKIVGENIDGFVYAVDGWNFSDTKNNNASNIGNWGEIIRLGDKLGNENDVGGLLTFDSVSHTIKIHNSTADNISDVKDFAAYALAFNYGSTVTPVLSFDNSVDSTADQNVILSGTDSKIDLTATGIIGIGRDKGGEIKNSSEYYAFSGVFNGNGKEIVLDIGNSYPFYSMPDNSKTNSHGYLSLFSVVNNATISNLTVSGNILMNVLNSNSNEPLRASGVVAKQKGTVTYENITAKTKISVKNDNSTKVLQAGFVSWCEAGTTTTFNNCTWNSELITDRTKDDDCIGGFLAFSPGNVTIVSSECTLSGSIDSNAKIARVGGFVAELNRYVNNKKALTSEITISNMMVSETVTTDATDVSGGFLGCHWFNTNVQFGKDAENEMPACAGLTICGAYLNANSAQFGGLVYQATGHWDATRADSILINGTSSKKTSISGTKGNYRGLIIGDGLNSTDDEANDEANDEAIYLEIGTWGSRGSSYYIDKNNVELSLNNNGNFDELVGYTIKDKTGNNNGIVSLWTDIDSTVAKIDINNACNTYTSQLGQNYSNGNTRYYYNLSHNAVNASELDNPQKVTTWSASQFAASNIRQFLCSNPENDALITDSINLTGYSYYPITPLASVVVGNINVSNESDKTTLKFDYEAMNNSESLSSDVNKPFDNSGKQHYLMQYGLLYNTTKNVEVNNTTISGTVGKENKGSNKYNSGALIFGSIIGDTAQNQIAINLNNVVLAGLYVQNIIKGTTSYAPLLINKITKGVKLYVEDLTTGIGYTAGKYAATSLIGKVGDSDSTKLSLDFSNIALDSRILDKGISSTQVTNNGTTIVEYHTTHTIFTKAILLDSFQYASDSYGVYNFNSDDSKVTYGVEISNTNTGRNPGGQYLYYDTELYVWDGTGDEKPTGSTIDSFYSPGNYLRYVREPERSENNIDNYHELDINLRPAHLAVGCGTYGDPYQIKDGRQLTALADYLINGKASKWVVCVNKTVLDAKKQESSNYHTFDSQNKGDEYFMCDGTSWYMAIEKDGKFAKGALVEGLTTVNMRAYLRNAYYQIIEDIEISKNDYMGIGGDKVSGDDANAFSGVIIGKAIKGEEVNRYPIVYISSAISNATNFGGLIRYSQGSVVKDLSISYEGFTGTEEKQKNIKSANISMVNNAVPGTDDNNPFFGGVVGYCMGGDTIIDNVSVVFGSDSIKLSGSKARLIATGGYVGLVGGGKNADGYEKTGGGVVFRGNIGNCTFGKTDETFYYKNPYVGRVLDGYACYDTQSADSPDKQKLDNTDKNYTIPYLVRSTDSLKIETNTANNITTYDVTVNDSQGLWLLSAIVNSGAGAMDSDCSYKEKYNGSSDSYNFGKPRSASYSKVGESKGYLDITDEKFWGGLSTENSSRVSYIVKNFTTANGEIYYASQITGGSNNRNPVSLLLSNDSFDMSLYGNGFRGIGSSFGNGKDTWAKKDGLTGHFLYLKEIKSVQETTVITLGLDRHDYWDNYSQNGWFVRGTGLFTGFSYQGDSIVQKITLCGKSKLTINKVDDGQPKTDIEKVNSNYGDVTVGGFAGYTVNASGAVTFNQIRLEGLEVYGGHHCGGIIGLLEQSVGTKNIKFTNWSIGKDKNGIGVKISKDTKNDGSSGGLLGWCRNGELNITGYGLNSSSWNIDGLVVENKSIDRSDSAALGGLIGATDGTKVTVNGVRVQNMTLDGTNMNGVGGIVASNKENNGNVSVSNCYMYNLSVTGQGNSKVGGVSGFNKNNIEINNVTIAGKTSISSINGHVGGLIGYPSSQLTLDDCHLIGTSDVPIKIMNGRTTESGNFYLGGLVGYNNSTAIIRNCSEEYVNILSGNDIVGGLLGHLNNSTNIYNINLSNVIVATNNKDKYVGLLVGNTNGKVLNGYNILSNECIVGYNANATIDNLSTVSEWNSNSTKVGLWLGNSSGSSTLVAVAVKGVNVPNKDVGSGTASIVYADYPAIQSYTTGSFTPYVDVNPKIDLIFKNEIDSENQTVLYGNGVGYTTSTTSNTKEDGTTETETIYKSFAEDILEETKSTSLTRRYWNVKEEDSSINNVFSQLLDLKNNTYVTNYFKEEQEGQSNPVSTNFPILVINNTGSSTDADTVIWNYIAALTNVSNGNTAKAQASTIEARTYKWNSSCENGNGCFVKQDASSLNVTGNKTIDVINKDVYDNQKNQITLLDVKYTDPTGGNSNGFHLYIPVLIKKVMNASFSVKLLAGTNYLENPYSNSGNYATAGFDETITAYIEYNYDRPKNDWQTMLSNGENLLWNYNKILNLAYKSNTTLPVGTKLTLVDEQTKQVYYHTFSLSDRTNAFDLEKMTFKDLNNSTKNFNPVPICDLLGLTVTANSNGDYVIEDNKENATVRVGDTYYRKANESDTGDKFVINLGENLTNNETSTNYLPDGEGYYLTIKVPKTEGVSVLNHPLTYASENMTAEGGVVSAIKTSRDNSARNYIIYDGVQQSDLLVSTLKNGVSSDTIMSDGDSIQVELTTNLRLTDKGREFFKNNGPTELNHQFNIYMKKYDENNSSVDVLIGAEEVNYTYSITNSSGIELYNSGIQNINNSDLMDKLEINCGKNTFDIATYLKSNLSDILTIKAVITLTYPTIGMYFPARNSSEDKSGIAVFADSRLATATSQLPTTQNKKTPDVSKANRYYTQNPSEATLIYNTYDGDALGDDTRKLGVNPSDTTNDINRTIYTSAVYNYANVEQSILDQASGIKYTMQLFQKDNNGSYGGPLTGIDNYLPTLVVSDNDQFSSAIDGTKSLTRDFELYDAKSDLLNIQIAPLTGEEFENNNFTYSNYKVVLTAVLLDENGQELAGTKATDYIVYTNARIYQRIVDTTSQ